MLRHAQFSKICRLGNAFFCPTASPKHNCQEVRCDARLLEWKLFHRKGICVCQEAVHQAAVSSPPHCALMACHSPAKVPDGPVCRQNACSIADLARTPAGVRCLPWCAAAPPLVPPLQSPATSALQAFFCRRSAMRDQPRLAFFAVQDNAGPQHPTARPSTALAGRAVSPALPGLPSALDVWRMQLVRLELRLRAMPCTRTSVSQTFDLSSRVTWSDSTPAPGNMLVWNPFRPLLTTSGLPKQPPTFGCWSARMQKGREVERYPGCRRPASPCSIMRHTRLILLDLPPYGECNGGRPRPARTSRRFALVGNVRYNAFPGVVSDAEHWDPQRCCRREARPRQKK